VKILVFRARHHDAPLRPSSAHEQQLLPLIRALLHDAQWATIDQFDVRAR
jgi:hypothetical protein